MATTHEFAQAFNAHARNTASGIAKIEAMLQAQNTVLQAESGMLQTIASAVTALLGDVLTPSQIKAITADLKDSADKLKAAIAAVQGQPHSHFERIESMSSATTPTGNAAIDALIAEAAIIKTEVASATSILNSIPMLIQNGINAALAAGATAAQLSVLSQTTADLTAAMTPFAAAIAANTPSAPPASTLPSG